MPRTAPLRTIEAQIAQFLLSNTEIIGNMTSALSLLKDKFEHTFPIEYTSEEKDLFFVITLNRFEQGAYDHENDF